MSDFEVAEVRGHRTAYERHGALGAPTMLLVHGWPESRRMWRHVTPALAEHFDVVAADLRGYGDSDPAPDEGGYDKGTMADDLFGLLDHLRVTGPIWIVGHDRGARVARRMAADRPERLRGVTLIDIMPMEWVFNAGADGHARRYFHWYFHLQRGLAEELIGARPQAYARNQLGRAHVSLDPDDVEHYVRLFARPHTIAATLGDYRTAFEVDRPRWEAELAQGHRIEVPVQLLWGDRGNLAGVDVLEVWRQRAVDVRGQAIADSGHYLAEEQPDRTLAALWSFAAELGLPAPKEHRK